MPADARLIRRRGISWWTLPAINRLGYSTAFFLRRGGISAGPFRGLNLGLNTDDDADHVHANRRLVWRAARFGPYFPVMGRQVHGLGLKLVTARDAGNGWFSLAAAPRATDGLLARTPGLPLAVTVSDCLPVVFAAEGHRAAAAVHAGWRGLAAGILGRAVDRFRRLWKIPPARIWAGVGPAIGPRAFAVQDDCLSLFRQIMPGAVRRQADGCWTVDLWKVAQSQLAGVGIDSEHMLFVRECTASHPRKYFSHRRDRITGRMLGMIQINAQE